MISIRVSDEEYASLLRICATSGARSVSDLTREAIRAHKGGIVPEDALSLRLNEFRAQLENLHRKLDLLTEELMATRPNGRH
jgi:hypothetical protein